jgi:hypothetical protein
MADAEDLKSSGAQAPCGFESRPRHQKRDFHTYWRWKSRHVGGARLPAGSNLASLLPKIGYVDNQKC